VKNGALWQHSRHWLNLRPVYAFGEWVLENLPLFVGYGITWGVTEVAYRTSPVLKAGIEANIRHVLSRLRPDLAGAGLEREVAALVHEIFLNRGRWFADLSVIAGRRQIEGLFRFHSRGNWTALQKSLAAGRGAILASAHLGNWFGGGYIVARQGIPVRSVMYRNHASEFMDAKVARRARVGRTFVGEDPLAMMEVIRALASGQVLAMLVDKPWDSRWVEAPFFGRPSRFPLGPVRIARLAGVPIFPAFCTWKKPREYEAVLCDPIEVRGGDPEEAEREAVGRLAAVIEEFVGSNLRVWFNFTPAWSPA
jgi:KDO2-lipid IV(A) lauroyltransferase